MKTSYKQEYILGRSIRIDNKSLILSVVSEEFLMQLFGRSMINSHGVISQKAWKKILKRLSSFIEKSADKNIASDQFHISRINKSIEKLHKLSDSKEVADNEIILVLTNIILELMGGTPDYCERDRLNRNSDYYLKSYRTLQYHQSPYNKMRTILEASRYKPYSDHHKYDDLQEVYYSEYNGNSEGFVNWYKNKYPKVYIQLF